MTEIKFTCPNCEKDVRAAASTSGRESTCPNCGCPIIVPYPDIDPGKVIGGFRVKKKLGAGGMGEVWLAEQLSMDRFVALKILSPTLVNDEEFVESFMHEIKIAAKLSHPNIITAHDAGEENGIYYLASTFVNGKELQTIIDDKRRLPERQALKIARAIARALQYAWDKYRIIHRDVKPGNIMIDRDDNVKLMDMGISKSVFEHEALTSGTAAGTPNYMSPEQARDLSGMDFRTDIYSLGVTLFRCLTGRMPFTGKNTEEIIRKHIQEIPPSVNELNEEISDSTAELVAKMLQKDRFQRHRTWQEVIDDIDNILRETADETQLAKRSQQKNMRILTALTALLTIAACGLYIVLQHNEALRKEKELTALQEQKASEIAAKEKEIAEKAAATEIEKAAKQETVVDKGTVDQPVEEILEEDRLLLAIENRIGTLKTEQQYREIVQELDTIRIIATKPSNVQKIKLTDLKLAEWEENALKKTISDLMKQAEKLAKKQEYMSAAELLKEYGGDWAAETEKERLQAAAKYEEQQREFDKKLAIEKEQATHAMAVRLADSILRQNLTEAEKTCKEINEEDAGYFSFDPEEALNLVRQLGSVKHLLANYLSNRIGKKVTLELADETKRRLVIEEVDADSFSASRSIGESSITVKLQLSQLSTAQRMKMLPDVSPETKALYLALDALKEDNLKKALKLIEDSGTIAPLLKEYLDVRSSCIKIMDNINVKSPDMSDKTASRVKRMKIKGDKAANLFIELLNFQESYPLYLKHSIYQALITCAENNFPLEHIFSGKVTDFDLQNLDATIEYDFSTAEQENDFEVYKPITMGQKVEVKDNTLTIGCRRHGSLIAIPSFTSLEASFEGGFRLRDFDHALVSKEKNIAFIAHGFGKYNCEEKDGVIRNWKLSDEEQLQLEASSLVPGISNKGSLKWDGEIIQYSINNKEWPKQVFMMDQARFAIVAFGTTNSYTMITLKGQLSASWFRNRILEIFSEE